MKNKKNLKKIIILRHNGGQLCNQLLLFTSIYAYCLEKGFSYLNYSFYEYNKYFNFKSPNFYVKIFELLSSFKFYKSHSIIYLFYRWSTYIYTFLKKGLIIKNEDTDNVLYLPPTLESNKNHIKEILKIEFSENRKIYTDGWAFRNPVGLKKYRSEIIKAFRPKQEIILRVADFMKKIGKNFFLIGVHIRQGEYRSKKFMGGSWYFSEKDVAEILRSYLKEEGRDIKKVLFILCSDGPLDLAPFNGLNIKLGMGSVMEDLITLSMCNLIIGSNSTFGSFAAYFGNTPFFIFDHEKKKVRGEGVNLFQY